MSGKVKLDRWMPHLRAAKREGKSLAAYAREQGLSKGTLYAAREMLTRQGKAARRAGLGKHARSGDKASMSSAFSAVRLAVPASSALSAPLAQLRAQLPNGVSVELVCQGSEARLMSELVQTLARLTCSDSTHS